jgi:hypothetical protein
MDRLDVAIVVALLALAMGYFWLSLVRSLELGDEGLILYHSARVAAGEVPYEDFPDTYGVGVFVLTGLVLRAFDGSIVAVRLMLAGLKALAVVLTYVLSRPVVGRPFAVFGALLSVVVWGRPSWNLNTPYAALFAVPLCLLACAALVRALRRDTPAAYAAAGVLGGLPILFKQTLGGANAWAMVFAACAASSLVCAPQERTRAGAAQFVAVWTVGAVLLLLPAARWLTPSDYALHFLPIHLFMAAVAAGALVHGASPVTAAAPRRLVPLALGLMAAPGLAIAFYAWRGQLPALVFNAMTLPASIINYYMPYERPPAGRCLLVLAGVAVVTAALLALGGRRRAAGISAVAAVALVAVTAAVHPRDALSTVAGPVVRRAADARWLIVLRTAPFILETAQPAAVLLATTSMLVPWLRRARELDARVLMTVLPLALLQGALSFQVFPRGTFNVWVIQGALMPLAIIVLYRWYRLGVAAEASPVRRIAAAILVSLLPLYLLEPAVEQMGDKLSARRAPGLAAPEARGIAPTEADARELRLRDVDRLVTYLREAEPGDAPVLPLTTDLMPLHLSGRAHASPQRDYYFFLLGLNMLPPADRGLLAEGALVCDLADRPETLVVVRSGPVTPRMLAMLPQLRDSLQLYYETATTIGPYSVLRRRASAQYPSSCAIRSR